MARIRSRIGPTSNDEGKELRVPCPTCHRETTHSIVRSAEYESSESEGDFSIDWWDEFQLVECKGCQTLSFRHAHRNTENDDHDPDTGEAFLVEQVALYPKRDVSRPEMDDVMALPWPIQGLYTEVLQALRNQMPVLASIGIRAIVESMCKDIGATGHNLEKKIDDLAVKGLVSRGEADTLHSLRLLGNQAAHEVKPHPTRDLEVAMDVIEHALSGIYVIPQRIAHLPQHPRAPKSGDGAGQGS